MARLLRVKALKLMFPVGVFLGRLLYRLRVEGIENMPSEGPCIIASTHYGPIGGFFTLSSIFARRKPESLAAFGAEILGAPVFVDRLFRPFASSTKRLLLQGGEEHLFLRAHKQEFSALDLLKALELVGQGKAVGLAVEGGMSWDGRLQPLKPGAAWLALRAHVPVVPIVAIGAYDILPRWATWPRLRGKLTVRVGKPFYLSDGPCDRVTNEMIQEASQKIWKEMAALLAGS